MTELTESEMNMLWSLIANQAKGTLMLLPLEQLLALRQAADRAISFGPFIDPTAFIQMDQQKVNRNIALLDATISYVRVLDKMRAEEVRQLGAEVMT